VSALAPLVALTSLNLDYCNGMTDKVLKSLAQLVSLTSLNLGHCDGVSDKGGDGAGSADWAHQPQLVRLHKGYS